MLGSGEGDTVSGMVGWGLGEETGIAGGGRRKGGGQKGKLGEGKVRWGNGGAGQRQQRSKGGGGDSMVAVAALGRQRRLEQRR